MVLRVVKYIWAFPNTLIGLILVPLGLASYGGIQLVDGVVEIYGGILRVALEKLIPIPGGASAITLGHVIIGRNRQALADCRSHEHVHVKQYERFGPMFLPLYFGFSLYLLLRGRDPYRENPFEKEAYSQNSP